MNEAAATSSNQSSPKHQNPSAKGEPSNEFEVIEDSADWLDNVFMCSDPEKYKAATGRDRDPATAATASTSASGGFTKTVAGLFTGAVGAISSAASALGGARGGGRTASQRVRREDALCETDLMALLRQIPLRLLVKRLVGILKDDGISILVR